MKALLTKVPALLPLLGLCAGILIWWNFFLTTPKTDAAFTDGSRHLCSGAVIESGGSPQGIRLIMEIDSVDGIPVAAFRAEISAAAGGAFPRPGDRAAGTLALRDAAVWNDLATEDYLASYYIRNDIAATAFVAENELLTTGVDSRLRRALHRYREWLVAQLAHSGVSDRTFALLSAIITGYDDELPADLLEDFRAIGIAHILALSGFHVGFIILLVSLLLYPMRAVYRLRRLRLVLSVILVWCYAAVVGLPLSVVRAVIMASVYTLGLAFGRHTNPYNSLCVALLIILAIWPSSLFAAGLQLSVSAVLGILAFAGLLNPVSPRKRLPYNIMAAVAVSVSAFIGTVPLTVLYFHRFPLIFLLGNLLATAVMPMWMTGGMLLIATSALGITHTWVSDFMDDLTGFVSVAVDRIAAIPWGEISDLYVEPWFVAAMLSAIALTALAAHMRSRKTWISAAVAIAAVSVAWPASSVAGAASDIVLVRAAGTTAIVCRDGSRCAVIHTAADRDHASVAQRLAKRLRGFAAVSGIDSVIFPESDFALGRLSREGEILCAAGRTIAIPSRSASCDTCAVDYLLLGTRFRGKLATLLGHCRPDTIVLGAELSRRRARQYADTAAVRGIPVIDLHESSSGTAR